MYWIESKVNTLFLLLASSVLLFSCSTTEKEDGEATLEDAEKKELTAEEHLIRQVENELKISAAEEYDIQIRYEYINSDTLKDALILVNRKDFAHKKAKDNGSENFFARTGYTGPYNYVFIKLGGSNKLLSTTPVGSNANIPLDVKFLELTSKAHRDFYIDYRIRNSMQRNYYTLRNNQIHLVFSCPVFDDIGEKVPKVYEIQHLVSPVRLAKDIALYYGVIEGYNPYEIEDVNLYEPKEIVGTDELYVYFIFDEKTMKYKTPMKAQE